MEVRMVVELVKGDDQGVSMVECGGEVVSTYGGVWR